jgi:hypothetical protein
MTSEKYVDTLGPGNAFREWLVAVLGERMGDRSGKVNVYRVMPASHTVCRYEFPASGLSVVAKFYGEHLSGTRRYDPVQAMENEFYTLKKIEPLVDIPRPLAMHRDFHCALLTEYIQGRSFYKYLKRGDELYDRLGAIASLQRRLHDQTKSEYRKEKVFAGFHKNLDQLRLDNAARTKFNRLLGEWWHSPLLDRPHGCRVHGDANPMNYLFRQGKVYMLDLESSREHSNPVHDLGIIAAELKFYFAFHRGGGRNAEPYIGHYLWRYAGNEHEFYAITRVLPFFMSQGLLRMAKLVIGPDERAFVFREAEACLESIRS